MKRTLVALAVIFLCILPVVAGTQYAVMEDGRVVELYDNGTYKIMGKSEQSGSKAYVGYTYELDSEGLVDIMLDMALTEQGYYPGSSEYEFMKMILKSQLNVDEMGFTATLKFIDEKKATFILNGEVLSDLPYTVDSDYMIILTGQEGNEIPIGKFHKDYKTIDFKFMELKGIYGLTLNRK